MTFSSSKCPKLNLGEDKTFRPDNLLVHQLATTMDKNVPESDPAQAQAHSTTITQKHRGSVPSNNWGLINTVCLDGRDTLPYQYSLNYNKREKGIMLIYFFSFSRTPEGPIGWDLAGTFGLGLDIEFWAQASRPKPISRHGKFTILSFTVGLKLVN